MPVPKIKCYLEVSTFFTHLQGKENYKSYQSKFYFINAIIDLCILGIMEWFSI